MFESVNFVQLFCRLWQFVQFCVSQKTKRVLIRSCFGSWGHLFGKMLILAPFSSLMSTFSFCINPWLKKKTRGIKWINRLTWRSSCSQMIFKKGILKSFAIFIGKHLFWSLFLIKLACNFIEKRLQHLCFPVNIAKFSRTFFYRTPLMAAFVFRLNFH